MEESVPSSPTKKAKVVKVDLADEPRAVLGVVPLPTDMALENEVPKLVECFPGVQLAMQKVDLCSEQIVADTYVRSQGNLSIAAKNIMMGKKVSVMGLGCTSMSFTLGPDTVNQHLSQGRDDIKTTDMARGQVAAIKALGAKKIALVTPYLEEVSAANQRMLEKSGIEVVNRVTMELATDSLTCRVTPECITEWAEAADRPEADAVVIGCSAFRACQPGFIDSLEKKLGKPVVTSTQAFMWSMLRTADIEDKISGYGALFAEH